MKSSNPPPARKRRASDRVQIQMDRQRQADLRKMAKALNTTFRCLWEAALIQAYHDAMEQLALTFKDLQTLSQEQIRDSRERIKSLRKWSMKAGLN